jgi:hypothetical protein
VAQQARKRRRRKHRGTQGGGIDTRGPRGRPRTREEAKARARNRQSAKGKTKGARVDRRDLEPTWRSAFMRGLFGSGIFFLLFWLVFGRPLGASLGLAVALLVIYVPLGYYVDRFFWRRRMRQMQAARAEAKQQRRSGGS